jgi:hypothetical protein
MPAAAYNAGSAGPTPCTALSEVVIYRTDWMRIIRSQAFVDLWLKAHQTYGDGLMVVRAMGTDERPVIDRRLAGGVPRGPRCHRVKVKDQYTVGTDADTDD